VGIVTIRVIKARIPSIGQAISGTVHKGTWCFCMDQHCSGGKLNEGEDRKQIKMILVGYVLRTKKKKKTTQ
jgi:hypothetical protein